MEKHPILFAVETIGDLLFEHFKALDHHQTLCKEEVCIGRFLVLLKEVQRSQSQSSLSCGANAGWKQQELGLIYFSVPHQFGSNSETLPLPATTK